MKSIISSDELDGKIAKAEKLHKKLVEILNHDKSKSTQITDSHPQTHPNPRPQQKTKHNKNRQPPSLSQQKIKTNIEARINIYKHELQQFQGLNFESYIAQIRKLEDQIKELESKGIAMEREIRGLEDGLKWKGMGKGTGAQGLGEFSVAYDFGQVDKLRKKLATMEQQQALHLPHSIEESQIQYQSSTKRKAKSSLKLLNTFEPQQQQKKKFIDKEAMYRNLIIYYEGQQNKLKKQIQELEKQKVEGKIKRGELEAEIRATQQKIAKEKQRLKNKLEPPNISITTIPSKQPKQ